jgi:hypothetical protein
MWSDVVQQGERLYFLRVFFWGASSAVVGTGLLVFALARARGSAIIRRFAWICVIFGGAELIVSVIGYRGVRLRDLSGATRLDRLAWLEVGLYLGLSAVGVTTSLVASSVRSRSGASDDVRLPLVGAGIAIALHGLALATLELLLVAGISR